MRNLLWRVLLGFLVAAVFSMALRLGSSSSRKFSINQGWCFEAIRLGPDGLWESLWKNVSTIREKDANDSSTEVPTTSLWQLSLQNWTESSRGVFRKPDLLINMKTEHKDVLTSTTKATTGLGKGKFDANDPLTIAFARLVDTHLSCWTNIEGVKNGLGKRGTIKKRMFVAMAKNIKLLPCLVHVRISKGRVYFRYGEFLNSKAKIIRANQGVKMIQDAVTDYKMTGLETELFLNVCDEPMSYDNSLSPGRSGFPVFSSHVTGGVTDIAVPDPLDLNFPRVPRQTTPAKEWKEMVPMAVFRGPSTNFDIKMHNYGSSPRFRLHYLSDVRPDLLDARITMWGSKDQGDTKEALIRNGFYLAPDLSEVKMSRFKYRLVVDDAVGTTGMCDALSRNQVALRQNSAFTQFFYPMILPGTHYIPVKQSFQNLFSTIEWMKKHDKVMQSLITAANEVASLICTWKSRTLYWAITLSKYAELAVEDVDSVNVPVVCNGTGIFEPASLGENCKVENVPCGNFCTREVPPEDWVWLSAQALEKLPRLDPFAKEYLG